MHVHYLRWKSAGLADKVQSLDWPSQLSYFPMEKVPFLQSLYSLSDLYTSRHEALGSRDKRCEWIGQFERGIESCDRDIWCPLVVILKAGA